MSWIPPDTNVQPGTHATKDSDPPDAEDEKKARQREVMAHGVSPLQAVQEKMPGAEDSIQELSTCAGRRREGPGVCFYKTVRLVRAETAGAADSTEDSCPLVSAANEMVQVFVNKDMKVRVVRAVHRVLRVARKTIVRSCRPLTKVF